MAVRFTRFTRCAIQSRTIFNREFSSNDYPFPEWSLNYEDEGRTLSEAYRRKYSLRCSPQHAKKDSRKLEKMETGGSRELRKWMKKYPMSDLQLEGSAAMEEIQMQQFNDLNTPYTAAKHNDGYEIEKQGRIGFIYNRQ